MATDRHTRPATRPQAAASSDRLPVISQLRQSVGPAARHARRGLVLAARLPARRRSSRRCSRPTGSPSSATPPVPFGAQQPPSPADTCWAPRSAATTCSPGCIWGAQTAAVRDHRRRRAVDLRRRRCSASCQRLLRRLAGPGARRDRRRDLRLPVAAAGHRDGDRRSAAGSRACGAASVAAAISITVVFIPQYFRVVRAEIVRIKAEAFVESAKVIGACHWRIMARHVCATPPARCR